MTADRQLRLSLYWRMLVALTVLTVVSLLVAATAVLVGGLVAWLGLIVINYVLETLFLPFAGEPYSVVGWILRSPASGRSARRNRLAPAAALPAGSRRNPSVSDGTGESRRAGDRDTSRTGDRQFGVAVLSRGRELAADRGAAELTGSPSALASALETLDDDRNRPVEDKRTWAKSASALDILPRGGATAAQGPLRTHPSTETRLEHHERLVAETTAGER